MGYRLHLHPDRRVHIRNAATQSVINIDNGVISNIGIPCYYFRGEIITRIDIMRIDHCGWPSPGRPDRSFQPYCHHRDHEVDFEAEGYEDVVIAFDDPPTGLQAYGTIDGSVIRVSITAMCQDAVSEDIDVPYAIYITGSNGNLRSVIAKGTLHIIAGPF